MNSQILIVDDDAQVRTLYKTQLGDEGYSIIEAKDLEEAKHFIRKEKIQAVYDWIRLGAKRDSDDPAQSD